MSWGHPTLVISKSSENRAGQQRDSLLIKLVAPCEVIDSWFWKCFQVQHPEYCHSLIQPRPVGLHTTPSCRQPDSFCKPVRNFVLIPSGSLRQDLLGLSSLGVQVVTVPPWPWVLLWSSSEGACGVMVWLRIRSSGMMVSQRGFQGVANKWSWCMVHWTLWSWNESVIVTSLLQWQGATWCDATWDLSPATAEGNRGNAFSSAAFPCGRERLQSEAWRLLVVGQMLPSCCETLVRCGNTCAF